MEEIWLGFLTFMSNSSPSYKLNLERGDIKAFSKLYM